MLGLAARPKERKAPLDKDSMFFLSTFAVSGSELHLAWLHI